MLCGSLDGRRIWGRMDTCICIAESLCCSPETITTLLIGYTQIQNKKQKKKKRIWVVDQLCVIWCICYLFNVKIIYFYHNFSDRKIQSQWTLRGKCLVCTNSLVKAAAIIISLWYQDSFPPPKWVWTPDHIPLIFVSLAVSTRLSLLLVFKTCL